MNLWRLQTTGDALVKRLIDFEEVFDGCALKVILPIAHRPVMPEVAWADLQKTCEDLVVGDGPTKETPLCRSRCGIR